MDPLLISIVGWIITIAIALWSARSGAKDTARKIAALEESTAKQVNSIKELAKIQIQLSVILIEKETWEARNRCRQLSEESFKSIENDHSMAGFPLNEFTTMMYQRKERDNHLTTEKDYYSKQISMLNGYSNRIKEIMNELEKV